MVRYSWLLLLLLPCTAFLSPSLPHFRTRHRLLQKSALKAVVGDRKVQQTFAQYQEDHARSISNIDEYWGQQAKMALHWDTMFTKIREGSFEEGKVSWFPDGKLNMCYNCIDRHLSKKAEDVAILWEGDDPNTVKTLTYRELHEQVCKVANIMLKHGVQKGDVVTIYMPTNPELATVMLACARIGAIHNVVFSGYAAQELYERIVDSGSKFVFTVDEMQRGGRTTAMKILTDDAIAGVDQVKAVFVYRLTDKGMPYDTDMDVIVNDELFKVHADCPVTPMAATDPLFVLYTVGTDGALKGLVYPTGGYALQTCVTARDVFGIRDGDVFGCFADGGLMAGRVLGDSLCEGDVKCYLLSVVFMRTL